MSITTNKTVYTPKDDTNSIIKKYYEKYNFTNKGYKNIFYKN